MARLTEEYWRKDKDIQLSNVRGFSMLEKLPKLIKKTYPDLASFKFGFFIKEDLPDRYADGWRHLTTEYFPSGDVDTFNAAIGLRFHLESVPEGLKYKANYIMIQPVFYHKERQDKIARISHDQFEAATRKEDGMMEGQLPTESKYEETPVKRGPGRQKKIKE